MALFGTVVIAGIIGYASEKSGFTHNGVHPVDHHLHRRRVPVLLHSRDVRRSALAATALNAIISSIGALVIVPTHYRGR